MNQSTFVRDIIILGVLLAALYLLSQYANVNVTAGLFNGIDNEYNLYNNCAGAVVVREDRREILRIASGETTRFAPSAVSEFWYENAQGEWGELELMINGSIKITGQTLPGRSDIFGRNPELVACPVPN